MRLSVLTGVLACAVVFSISTATASASTSTAAEDKEVQNIAKILAEGSSVDLTVEEFIEALEVSDEASENEEAELQVDIHEVKKDESLSDIAEEHETTWRRLYDKNDHIEDPDYITVGMKLVIPEEDEELPSRELPVIEEEPTPAPSSGSSSQAQQSQSSSVSNSRTVQSSRSAPRGSSRGNRYVAGYCTWYVKNKRTDLPNTLGDARTWFSRAAAQGMATGSTPRAGAVGQRGNHVVYVESVNKDGTVTISEMNHKGLYVRTVRTLPSSYFRYIY